MPEWMLSLNKQFILLVHCLCESTCAAVFFRTERRQPEALEIEHYE